jgi:nucleoside-diphosphate-sugar epimerase
MLIFVTGGSGFIGGHIIEALVRAGHTVRALARSASSRAAVEALGAEAVRGELGQIPADVLAGADAVIHAAAHVEQWGDPADFERVNIEGTRQLLDAAEHASVRRFIHISSEAVLFAGQDMRDLDEAAPYPIHHPFLYPRTKAAAEQLVLARSGPTMHTIALRPRMVWGPRDRTILPELLEMVARGRFAWIDQGRAQTSTTHVFNLAHAALLALEHGAGGHAYFVTDEADRSLREFMTALAATRGVELPSRSMPGALVRPLAGLVEGAWRVFALAGTPPLHRYTASLLSRRCTLRTARARAELGYAPIISFEQGISELYAPG